MTQTASPDLPPTGQTVSPQPSMDGNGCEASAFTLAHWLPAVDTLIQAFADDPVAKHLFPDAAPRRTGMAHVFRMQLRYGQLYGWVDVLKSAGAVAVWIRPEYTTPYWTRLVRVGLLASPFTVGWSATRRMLRFEHFIADCRMRTLAGPHWFLLCIGVRPGQQGQGLGAALIRHGLQRIQSTGVPCYLETANERNLVFYQKNGFRLVGQQLQPSDGPGIWSLVAGGHQ